MDIVNALREMRADVVSVGDALGFQKTDFETLPIRLMCVMAEIDELERALEFFAAGVADELADVAIYLVRVLTDLEAGAWCPREPHFPNGTPTMFETPDRMTRDLRRHVVTAFEHWRRGRKQDAVICCEQALRAAAVVALRTGTNLPVAVRMKLDANRLRSPLHGGKDPRS